MRWGLRCGRQRKMRRMKTIVRHNWLLLLLLLHKSHVHITNNLLPRSFDESTHLLLNGT